MAAGRGSRMKHLAKNKPKHLINVLGRPFIYYLLQRIYRAGYERIILVVGYNGDLFEEFAKNHRQKFPLELVNQLDRVPQDKYGTAVPIEAVADKIGTDSFACAMGDNLYGINDLRQASQCQKTSVFGFRHSSPERYGVLEGDENNYLNQIHEKKTKPITDVINSGLYFFCPEIFHAVAQIGVSPRGEYEITDAISALAARKRVKVKLCQDPWLDFGRLPDIPRASRFLQSEQLAATSPQS